MNKITLGGCAPTPLAGYLKSLGVMAILSSADPELRAAWRAGKFALHTRMTRDEALDYLLNTYSPTPIMAPWNGGSGFYEKDNQEALKAIKSSTASRFSNYRTAIQTVEEALADFPRDKRPEGKDKIQLQMLIRGSLPDEALPWFDAAVLLSGESPKYPPLLGSGGNDGRLDFTNNFMQRLGDVISLSSDGPPDSSMSWLQASLFGAPTPGLLNRAIGQFAPNQAGGLNAGTGFAANASMNPWDYVLMIEGSLLFAAAAVRRNEESTGALSYPFTVRAVGAGAGNLGYSDMADARGELWMPLWDQPALHKEIRALIAEGRVALNRKPARDALDFVRAVHKLGSYRGIHSFQRFGLLMRSGRAYLATPLGRMTVQEKPQPSVLDELDEHRWLDNFRRFSRGENAPASFKRLCRLLEDQFFELTSRVASVNDMQSVLALLGQIQQAIATSKEARESISPVPALSSRWISAANDNSAAFRITAALAGLHGTSNCALPLRSQLFPIERSRNRWVDGDTREPLRTYSSTKGHLVDTLIDLLQHRLEFGERLKMGDKPLRSSAGATLDDLAEFLQNPDIDQRINELLPGLSLCRIPLDVDHARGEAVLPGAYALMKLAITPDRTLREIKINHRPLLRPQDRLPIPKGMVAQLAAGNANNRATRLAWRRLRASGLAPVFGAPETLPAVPEMNARRTAAALLIPLRFGSTAALTRNVLIEPDSESVSI